MQEGEKIIDQLRLSGTKVSVQARTALLKGYVLTGKMDKAFELFRSMLYSKGGLFQHFTLTHYLIPSKSFILACLQISMIVQTCGLLILYFVVACGMHAP